MNWVFPVYCICLTYFEYAKHLATYHIFLCSWNEAKKGWVKVTYWNSFETGNLYQLFASCLLF